MRFLLLLFFALLMPFTACADLSQTAKQEKKDMNTLIIKMKTTLGEITLELYPDKAPVSVKNFLSYVNNGHYKETIFHRVIDGFMIQGGGFTKEMTQKETGSPIKNEADNRLQHKRGTIAMARTGDIHSATAQFFINISDNAFLNFRDHTPSGYGYCVFGKVIDGIDVVDKIKSSKTTTRGAYQDVPVEPIVILDVVIDASNK